MENAKKAYESYKKITSSPELSALTSNQNILFTILHRAKTDEAFKKEIEAFILPDGSGISLLDAINTFFANFSASHGVDITEGLTVLDNLEYPEGLYFTVKTYKEINGEMTEISPIDLVAGERVYFKVWVLNALTDIETAVPFIVCDVLNEGGDDFSLEAENTSLIEFSALCNREGSVRAMLTALDKDKNPIKVAAKGSVGAVFDYEKILPSSERPDDFAEFWKAQVERIKAIAPNDPTPPTERYEGYVKIAFDVDLTNKYSMKRVDEVHLQMLRDKKLSRKSDDILKDFELYEFSLKCAGPCPATGYLSYPKNKPSSSLPLVVHYDGYGAHSVEPFFDEGAIVLHSTHHGYPCGLSDDECYKELNSSILAHYGRGNGHANANFDVKDDCYNLYIHLRNLQAIRFFINPEFSKDLPEVARLWNKKIELIGGSLGGYQSLGTAALLPFIDEEYELVKTVSRVPAFCDYKALLNGRNKNIFGIRYAENSEYFDLAHLASLVDSFVEITRLAFGDELCCTSNICAAYNSLRGKKEMTFYQNSSHGYIPKNNAELQFTVEE